MTDNGKCVSLGAIIGACCMAAIWCLTIARTEGIHESAYKQASEQSARKVGAEAYSDCLIHVIKGDGPIPPDRCLIYATAMEEHEKRKLMAMPRPWDKP